MSQYRLTGKSASRSYELLVGWDTPLSRFFLVIEPELDEPVYSNIYEKDPSSWGRFGKRNLCTLGAFFNRY